MPNMDGTGPRGQGAGTGRGLGPCGAGRRQNRSFGFFRGGNQSDIEDDRISKIEEENQKLKKELKELKEKLDN